MDVSKEKQLANEMADYCMSLSNMPKTQKRPWKSIILNVVMAALVGGAAKPDNNWGDVPR